MGKKAPLEPKPQTQKPLAQTVQLALKKEVAPAPEPEKDLRRGKYVPL